MEPKYLSYLAQFENSIERNEQAIEVLKELADKNPDFDQKDRQLLVLIFKNAIDPIRETIRSLRAHQRSEEEQQNANITQLLKENIDKSLSKLNVLCQSGLDLVQKTLIPACKYAEGIAFYQKLNGDLYRYLTEFSEGEEHDKMKASAKEAYTSALEAAQQLSPANPTRLGVILNFAVFKYEHADEKDDAKVMVSNAIKSSGTEIGNLSESTKQESLNVIDVMQKNLASWSATNYSDIAEEDEEEATGEQIPEEEN